MSKNQHGSNFFSPVSSTLSIALTDGSPNRYAVLAECTGTPPTTAGLFQHGCIMIQSDSATNAVYQNTGTPASPVWTLFDTALGGAATTLVDSNQVTALDVGTTASAVNYLRVTDAATGTAPILSSVGTDTNIGLTIIAKGSGSIGIGTVAGAGTGQIVLGNSTDKQGVGIFGALAVTSNSATALVVGPNGTTNPTLLVNSNTASAATGISITGAATGAGVALTVISSGTDEAITITSKGNGAITIGGTASTGTITIGQPANSNQTVTILGTDTNGVSTLNLGTGLVNNSGSKTVNIATGASTFGTNTVNIGTGATTVAGGNTINIGSGTPTGSGTNRITLGGTVATATVSLKAKVTSLQAINYISSETGSNNAIAGALTDAAGSNVALAAGLRVLVKLGHTLQAGANTFNLNGGGAVNIKSHLNVANNIATAYAATGVIDLFYDGTEWLDMSQ